MISRRKVKKIIFIGFFTLMVLKIHKDYLELSHDNEKLFKNLIPSLNQSSQISLMTLNNIQDNALLNKIQAKTNSSKYNGQFKLHSNASNSEEQNAFESSDDNRIHYVPSFKKKMEETMHQLLNRTKTELVQQTGTSKPNIDIQRKESTQESAKLSKSIEILNKENKTTIRPTKIGQILFSNKKKLLLKSIANQSVSKQTSKITKAKRSTYKVSHVVDKSEISLNQSQILKIKNITKDLNEFQHIYNLDKFGPLTSEDTVIVIQVHNRLENLKYLVESLTNVKYINRSLVIFSHDYWDNDINHFVRSISAFKVMQIFFPFSIQLNPFSYPGRDPRDCLWNENKVKKRMIKKV